ncbi:MAG: CPBP family intramembrane glutamic endopeptidase [Chitinophagaceae bacterium]|nr:CPBP family intramembrane metalloprotease [Chitinophagaceae bacterium]MCB0741030.1 CPBP family intramembrane metalloprotease [Chitinophagaceae bacterium]
MYDNHSKGISYIAGFFILIAFVIVGVIMAGLLSIPIWQALTGLPFSSMADGMSNPANANAVKMIQVVTTIVGFLLPAIVTAYLLNRRPMHLLGYKKSINRNEIVLVAVIMLTALFFSSALAYFNDHIQIAASLKEQFDKMEADYNNQAAAILTMKNFGDYLIALFVMAFLPALCEETLFRGGLQNFLARSTKKPWAAIIVVSILFSLAHLSYYGFLSRLFLGIILGAIFYYSGKLWLSIIGHFINNAIAITMVYISMTQGKSIDTTLSDTSGETWAGVFVLPILILVFYYFIKITKKEQEQNLPVAVDEESQDASQI